MEEESGAPPINDPQRVWRTTLLVAAVGLLCAACLFYSDLSYLLVRKGMTQSQVRTLLGKPDYYDLMPDSIPPPDDCKDAERRCGWFYTPGLILRKGLIVEWNPEGRVSGITFLP